MACQVHNLFDAMKRYNEITNRKFRMPGRTKTMNFNNFTIKSQEAVQKAMEIAAAK